jgi:hypothetical protein
MPSRFTESDLLEANKRMKMLTFYPPDPEAQAAIMELLARMCPHREALQWLVDQMVNCVGTWKGPMELRGVLCWHYPPADGIEANCSISGFTPADGERLTLERGYEYHPRELEAGDPEMRALVLSIADQKRLM